MKGWNPTGRVIFKFKVRAKEKVVLGKQNRKGELRKKKEEEKEEEGKREGNGGADEEGQRAAGTDRADLGK